MAAASASGKLQGDDQTGDEAQNRRPRRQLDEDAQQLQHREQQERSEQGEDDGKGADGVLQDSRCRT